MSYRTIYAGRMKTDARVSMEEMGDPRLHGRLTGACRMDVGGLVLRVQWEEPREDGGTDSWTSWEHAICLEVEED